MTKETVSRPTPDASTGLPQPQYSRLGARAFRRGVSPGETACAQKSSRKEIGRGAGDLSGGTRSAVVQDQSAAVANQQSGGIDGGGGETRPSGNCGSAGRR